ncbi:MAG: phage tail protein [Candidatus Latescibacterota bacterium]|nr:MAG: phage tail protein [Candidatus Latescibacterota bacterium]
MRRGFRAIGLLLVIGFALSAASAAWGSEFSVNTHRFDPYKQFKFRVKWDGKYVPGVLYVSGLTRTTEVVTSRKGDSPSIDQRSPGQTIYEPIVLERGRTHDQEFEKWANKVWNFGSGLGSEASLEDFRKDIIIELYNEAGQLAMAWKVYRCWPSKYSAVTQFDASAAGIAIESMTLDHEGWERDYDIAEPSEPSFTEP